MPARQFGCASGKPWEAMAMDDSERRQRWAAFSVKAHRDLMALASDVLLYDRIILPVPEDDEEYERWVRQAWAPEEQAKRLVQAAAHIIPVPWTKQLRAEWRTAYDQLRDLSTEVAYGMTGQIYASSPQAWNEIYDSVYADERPARKPFLIAGYQSESEAVSALDLKPLSDTDIGAAVTEKPGERPADRAVALHVQRMVEEPDIADPEQAFLASVKLADNAEFVKARRRLFDWEDALYVDQLEPEEIASELADIEEQYNAAVRDFARYTRRRRAASVLPGLAGDLAALAGHPHLKLIGKGLSFVAGRFVRVPPKDPNTMPGHAVALIRAAYRDLEARQAN
jgi:hypothetical protein